ncbi:hypothetical protein SS50377_23835 [Spironucleus salmonicida]|uniref:Uncharacterized protein n=1 Tax=Spironucleus salmonicida TaxID=348837 RepID=V6LHV5_9EUKA|nr:hypothetical protein SS50377_23835 [Spironucleus salmonicida]|eukprot:EST44137.1 Hypothetical protein SS50377_16038 [Spironucleus salmonicida]
MKSRWSRILQKNKMIKVKSQDIIAHKLQATNYSYFQDNNGEVIKGYYHPLHFEADFLVEESDMIPAQ